MATASGTMDSHLLVVSGVSSCGPRSETKMNPKKGEAADCATTHHLLSQPATKFTEQTGRVTIHEDLTKTLNTTISHEQARELTTNPFRNYIPPLPEANRCERA